MKVAIFAIILAFATVAQCQAVALVRCRMQMKKVDGFTQYFINPIFDTGVNRAGWIPNVASSGKTACESCTPASRRMTVARKLQGKFQCSQTQKSRRLQAMNPCPESKPCWTRCNHDNNVWQ